MVNDIYNSARESFLKGEINWLTNDIKAVLVNADLYTPDLGSHKFLTDIPVISRVATSGNLTGKTADFGIADARDITLTSVFGADADYIVVYQDTGNQSTSRLITYIDSASGLPITPNGGDITVQWPNGPFKIFRL